LEIQFTSEKLDDLRVKESYTALHQGYHLDLTRERFLNEHDVMSDYFFGRFTMSRGRVMVYDIDRTFAYLPKLEEDFENFYARGIQDMPYIAWQAPATRITGRTTA